MTCRQTLHSKEGEDYSWAKSHVITFPLPGKVYEPFGDGPRFKTLYGTFSPVPPRPSLWSRIWSKISGRSS